MSFKLFFRSIIFSGIVAAILILFSIFSVNNEANKLKKVEERKVNSLLLSYELRQSSDDLTRLARTYAVTGNSDYEKMYWDIIKIRNGEAPRPKNYNRIYWDFVIDYKDKPIDKGRKVSLLKLMKETGFTKKEFKLLDEAKNNSDGLIKLETIAMNAVKGFFADNSGNFTIKKEPNKQMAIELLHSKKYHTEKAKIMKPVNEFMILLERRTNKEVEAIQEKLQSKIMILMIVIAIIVIFYIVLFYMNRNKIKNLHLFKDELINFFKYINKEIPYSGTINIKETGEIKEMVDVVNKNITKTKENIEQDENVIKESISMLSSFEKGDLSKRVETRSNDESILKLTVLLNQTAQNLNDKIDIILKALNEYTHLNYTKRIDTVGLEAQVLELAKGINTLADSTTNSLKENKEYGEIIRDSSVTLLKNIDVLNTNTNSTAAALEETAAAIEEINANANQNLNNVVKMSQNASTLTEATTKGQDLAFQTAKAMENINEQVTSINEAISVIDQIAFQTNILSLNAAVEAATAGEAGKGFAVVAQEVRNLANRSAEAAKEIKDIVELATSKAQDGKNIAEVMVNDYNSLNENILKNIKLIKDVETANKEQGRGIEQINDSINSLDKRTQENASIANQTHEVAKKADDIAKKIEDSTNKVTF